MAYSSRWINDAMNQSFSFTWSQTTFLHERSSDTRLWQVQYYTISSLSLFKFSRSTPFKPHDHIRSLLTKAPQTNNKTGTMHFYKFITFTASLLLTLTPHALAAVLGHPLNTTLISLNHPLNPTSPSLDHPLNTISPSLDHLLNTTSPFTDLVPRTFTYTDCKGSGYCFKGLLEKLIRKTIGISDQCKVKAGQPLLCFGVFCVFNEDTKESLSIKTAVYLMFVLKYSGCEGCGSVETAWPNSVPGAGRMRIDWVPKKAKKCDGFCGKKCWRNVSLFSGTFWGWTRKNGKVER